MASSESSHGYSRAWETQEEGGRSLPFHIVQEWEMIYHVPARDREQQDLKMLTAGMKGELQ